MAMATMIVDVGFLNGNRWPRYLQTSSLEIQKVELLLSSVGTAHFSHLAIYLLPSEANTFSP